MSFDKNIDMESSSAGSYSDKSSLSYSSYSSEESTYNIDLTGDIINNYNVISKLGSGSYSIVWLVYSIKDYKYYAMKVQNPEDYDDGMDEIDILKKISHKEQYINGMIEYFIESYPRENDSKIIDKFICSIFNLCAGNLDGIARKGMYKNGYPIPIVKKILKQICKGLEKIHTKLNGFHGDIKPDNILLCGFNNRDIKYIEAYNNANYIEKYIEMKNQYLKDNKKKKISRNKKLEIRKTLHKNIIDTLPTIVEDNIYFVDTKYIEEPHIKITDFGFYCHNDEKFNESFGTRYYQAPEILLMGSCTEKVDIWALGCMLFELVTGKILFDPADTDETACIDTYHLEMMINLCGEFPSTYLSKMKRQDKFFKKSKLINIKYDEMYMQSTLNKIQTKLKCHNIDDPILCELLESMLIIIPDKRIRINQILNHKWLTK